MANVGLLYVGAVLFINGLSLVGWVKGKSLVPMNLFVGLLQVVTPLYIIFAANGDVGTILGASGLFLFGFTYLYVAMNNTFDLDGTGLGWFCGYVVIAAIPFAYLNFQGGWLAAGGASAVSNLLGVLWLHWAFLWFLFWLVLAMGRTSLTRYTGAVCASQGILTGWLPALLLLGAHLLPSSLQITNELAIAVFIALVALEVIWLFTVKTPQAIARSAT